VFERTGRPGEHVRHGLEAAVRVIWKKTHAHTYQRAERNAGRE
jgi:hypothetical protein